MRASASEVARTSDPEIRQRLELSLARAPDPTLGLVVEDGRFLLDGEPFTGIGLNYYTLFKRLLRQPRKRSTLDGLAQLAELGVPFVRFNAGCYYQREWRRYLEDPVAYFAQLDRVVSAAEELDIGLVPCLFWNLTLHDVVGEELAAWGDPGSRTRALMRRYVREIVLLYRHSPAIWAWEFTNELNLKVDLPNAERLILPGGDVPPTFTSQILVDVLVEFAREVRRHDPYRAISSGNSQPRPSAWHNTAEESWTQDTHAQWREILLRDNPAPLDTLSFHVYGGHIPRDQVYRWSRDNGTTLRAVRDVADEVGRPIFLGEFGLETKEGSTPESLRADFRQLLLDIVESGVDVAALWDFDNPNQPAWSVGFEGERAFMLAELVRVNAAY